MHHHHRSSRPARPRARRILATSAALLAVSAGLAACGSSTPTAAQKEKFLETFSASKNLPAVKNHCFLPLSYDEVTPSPRNAQAVVAIAKWLHPSAFGLPADGS